MTGYSCNGRPNSRCKGDAGAFGTRGRRVGDRADVTDIDFAFGLFADEFDFAALFEGARVLNRVGKTVGRQSRWTRTARAKSFLVRRATPKAMNGGLLFGKPHRERGNWQREERWAPSGCGPRRRWARGIFRSEQEARQGLFEFAGRFEVHD